LILFGFKGCGKTYYGKRLAERLGKQFVDTDKELIHLFKRDSVREVHQLLGEAKFRLAETVVIRSLGHLTDSIIALGGGGVMSSENQEILKKIGQMVYLEANFDMLKKRIEKLGVPSVATMEQLRTLYHDRLPVYESISARRVNTNLLDEAGVLAELEAILYLEDPTDGL
jgi:shikimate kinase